MPTLNTTPNQGYQLPFGGNDLSVDVARVISAISAIDVDVASALAALAAKAGLASPAFTGTPTAPTATPGTDTGQLATTAFVKAALDALIGGAPGALDTLNELAAAIGDDADYAASTVTALAGKLARDGSNFTDDTEKATFRVAAGISALFDETLTDDLQVQKVTTAVSYVEFDIPASDGECFMLMGLGIRSTNNGNITFQTSPLTAFDSGATDYDAKWHYAVGAATPVSGTLQSGAPVITSEFYGDAGAQYIPVSFQGLLFAGNANVWPSFMVNSSYYSTADDPAVQSTQVYRRASGRIAKLRFGHTGGTLTRGTFILARIRGS